MVRSLERRVARLEESAGGGECPYCGDDGEPPSPDDAYEVIFAADEDLGPEFCPECGRQLVVTITWGDEAL